MFMIMFAFRYGLGLNSDIGLNAAMPLHHAHGNVMISMMVLPI